MKKHLWDNTLQLHRIRYRFVPYIKVLSKALSRGISIRRLVVSRYPFKFSTSKRPASITVEFTDACDLKCVYCNNPLFANPRIFMKDETLNSLVDSLREFNVDRVRVSGGEPTLHPKFRQYSEKLRSSSKFLSLITNGQWKKGAIIPAILENYDMVEISVDSGGAALYEESRKNSSYDLLLANMMKFQELKEMMNSKTHVNIRFMVRPSTDENKHHEYNLWRQLSDSIMPQYIVQHAESEKIDDVYTSVHVEENDFPKCTLPFKDMQVKASGNIPLCQVTGSTIRPERKKFVGNIRSNTLKEVWNGQELTTIRNAHRNRVTSNMEICRGCKGC